MYIKNSGYKKKKQFGVQKNKTKQNMNMMQLHPENEKKTSYMQINCWTFLEIINHQFMQGQWFIEACETENLHSVYL